MKPKITASGGIPTSTAIRILQAIDEGRISALADAHEAGVSESHLTVCLRQMRALGVVIVTNQGWGGGKGRATRPWRVSKRGPFARSKR